MGRENRGLPSESVGYIGIFRPDGMRCNATLAMRETRLSIDRSTYS